MKNYILDKRLVDITVGEFLEVLVDKLKSTIVVEPPAENGKTYVYGLAGIAELYGCSKTQANRIKQSGKIDEAITQIGNMIIVDAEKALSLHSLMRKQVKNK